METQSQLKQRQEQVQQELAQLHLELKELQDTCTHQHKRMGAPCPDCGKTWEYH